MAGPLFFLRGAQKEGKGKGEEGPPTQKNVGRRPLRKKKIPGCQNKFSNNNKSLAQDKPEGEFCVNIGELVPHTKKAPPVKKLHQHFWAHPTDDDEQPLPSFLSSLAAT